jgi:hypothetical protein
VLILAVVASVLALQGWGGRFTSFDLVPHAIEAEKLIERGSIPSHGCLSSFGSFIPPGTSWLIVPGQWLFSDPRLETTPGALVLFFLSVFGVYRLARWCFDRTAGVGAVALFCMAPASLGVAVSLWPRFPMAATVWFTYFTARWAYDRKPAYLGAALVALMLGLYVHMEGLILLVGLALVWGLLRPPVQFRYLLMVLVVSLVVWLPYLKFEHNRNYVDIKSQLTRHSLFYDKETLMRFAALANTYGLPKEDFKPLVGNVTVRHPSLKVRVWESSDEVALRLVSAFKNLSANYSGYGWGWAGCTGLSVVVLLFALAQMCSFIGKVKLIDCGGWIRNYFRITCPAWLVGLMGSGLLFFACIVNEWSIARFLSADGQIENYTIRPIRLFQVMAAAAGIILLARKPMVVAVTRLVEKPMTPLGVVSLALVPPWIILMWLASPDQPYRFWSLWPLHAVLMMGIIKLFVKVAEAGVPSGYEAWRKEFAGVVVGLLLLIMMFNPVVMSRLGEWREQGWVGGSDEVMALDRFGKLLADAGVKESIVGYDMPYQPFMANFHVLDSLYKIGLNYDWYFWRKHGIRNLSRSPAGVSGEDRYRFVVMRNLAGNEVPSLQVPFPGGVRVDRQGIYSFWKAGK